MKADCFNGTFEYSVMVYQSVLYTCNTSYLAFDLINGFIHAYTLEQYRNFLLQYRAEFPIKFKEILPYTVEILLKKISVFFQ